MMYPDPVPELTKYLCSSTVLSPLNKFILITFRPGQRRSCEISQKGFQNWQLQSRDFRTINKRS